MEIFYKDKKIEIEVRKVRGMKKFVGLMFSSTNKKNLLFDFGNGEFPAIHSFFVFYNFLALWLDEKNSVVDFHIVKPFTFLARPRKKAVKLAELPFNDDNKKIIDFFVGK